MSEFISKLSPQSCNPIRLGGEPSLTSSDITHACTNLNELGYLIICIKYGGDTRGFAALHKLLSKRIMTEAKNGKWKRSRLPCLVTLAINEHCGTRIYKDKDRCEAIKISPSTWCRIWKGKYRRLLELLDAYEQSAIYLIKRRLK